MVNRPELDCFIQRAKTLIGRERVLEDRSALEAYSFDAYVFEATPNVIVFPQTADEVRDLVSTAIEHALPYVARGAGTGYAGGSVPVNGGIVISLQDMVQIVEFNEEEGWIWVQPGVTTGKLSEYVLERGWRYPPDPSSYRVSTIGGNIATNAGGPHCLGYGVTSNYVLELEVVTPDGKLVRVGGETSLAKGLDLRGLFVGSEGTFGIVTGARLRLIRQPPAISTYIATFKDIESAIATMEAIFGKAIVPIALELTWSALVPVADGCEARGDTFMFIELEGPVSDVQTDLAEIEECVSSGGGTGRLGSKASLMDTRMRVSVQRIREARVESAAKRYFLFDAVVPRSRLLGMMRVIEDVCSKYRMSITNTFHAGDGNIHPSMYFTNGDPDLANRLSGAWRDLLLACADAGGALTGEHGVGIEKRAMMHAFFDRDALQLMINLHEVLGSKTCNPGKIIPESRSHEYASQYRRGARFAEDRIYLDLAAAHVEVGPEVTLAELHTELAPHLYQLPYDPIGVSANEPICQIFARGCPSLRELRFGCPRDLIVGGLVNTGSGKSVRLGGIINKDVGGYDLRKLLFNSRGQVGEIKRLRLRLVPKPRAATQISVQHPHLATLLSWMREVFFSAWGLSALFLRSIRGVMTLQIVLEGSRQTVLESTQRIRDVVGENATVNVNEPYDPLFPPFHNSMIRIGFVGQPWNRERDIGDYSGQQKSFLAFAGSRFCVEEVDDAASTSNPIVYDEQIRLLERRVIDAFERL